MIRVITITAEKGSISFDGKRLEELTEESAKDLAVIGKGVGFSVGYCAFLASKYSPNFEDRVVGYRIMPQDDPVLDQHLAAFGSHPLGTVAVEFYGRKL